MTFDLRPEGGGRGREDVRKVPRQTEQQVQRPRGRKNLVCSRLEKREHGWGRWVKVGMDLGMSQQD